MDATKLGDYLTVVGNLGLILGLILVGYQIKQTNDLAQLQLMSDGFALGAAVDFSYIGENAPEVLAKVDDKPSDLSDQDILLLERIFRVKLGEAWRNTQLRKAGMSNSTEIHAAQDLAFEFNSAFGRMYWDTSKDFVPLSQSFVAEVDRNFTLSIPSKVDFYRSELEKRLP